MGNLSTVRCLSELNKDDPVSEGGRQEGSDKKQLEKVVLFSTRFIWDQTRQKNTDMPKMRRLIEFSFSAKMSLSFVTFKC